MSAAVNNEHPLLHYVWTDLFRSFLDLAQVNDEHRVNFTLKAYK